MSILYDWYKSASFYLPLKRHANIAIGLMGVIYKRYYKNEPARDVKDCISDLKVLRTRIQDSINDMQASHDKHIENIRNNISTENISAARQNICMRQMLENELNVRRRTLTSISGHIIALESTVLNNDVIRILRSGSLTENQGSKCFEIISHLDDQYDDNTSLSDRLGECPVILNDDDIESELKKYHPRVECDISLPSVPKQKNTTAWIKSKSLSSEVVECEALPTLVC